MQVQQHSTTKYSIPYTRLFSTYFRINIKYRKYLPSNKTKYANLLSNITIFEHTVIPIDTYIISLFLYKSVKDFLVKNANSIFDRSRTGNIYFAFKQKYKDAISLLNETTYFPFNTETEVTFFLKFQKRAKEV